MTYDKGENKIKELRKKAGISQELLAKKSGLNLRTIQRIENGETEARGDSLKRIANALNTTIEELCNWELIDNKSKIQNLNFSNLLLLFLPIVGCIFTVIIWMKNKDSFKGVKNAGKSVLNFQFTLILAGLIGFLLIAMFADINTENMNVESIINMLFQQITLILILWITLITAVLINYNRVNNNRSLKYLLSIPFLR